MNKISGWFLALVTAAVSLAAMLVFDYLLSLLYFYMGKVPFLTGILEFVGELLDLGLTALVAAFVATTIWKFGHTLIEKMHGEKIPYEKGPMYIISVSFIFIFFAVLIFVGYHFFANIGDAVGYYTADMEGWGKVLMFLKAVKEVFVYVRSEYILIYKIGFNSMILAAIAAFVPRDLF